MDFIFLNSKAHLLLLQSSSEVSGGAELQVALLARELAARGFETIILHGSDSQGDEVMAEGVRCLPSGPFHTGKLRDVWRAIGPVFGSIASERPKHVLVLGWTAWLFLLLLAKPFLGYRLVFICGLDTEADGSFAREHGVRGQLFDFAMRFSDVRFAMSEKQIRLFEERGMQSEFYRNLVLSRKAPRTATKEIDLLWIARCRPIKRPLLFVNLARRLPQARAVMVCPPEDQQLFAEVHQAAAEVENLEIIEYVPYSEVQNVYDRAKIFVNTSVAEGFANSFIQSGLGGAAILSLLVDCDGVLQDFHAGESAGDNFEQLVRLAERWLVPGSKELTEHQIGSGRFVQANHDTKTNVDAFLKGLRLERQ